MKCLLTDFRTKIRITLFLLQIAKNYILYAVLKEQRILKPWSQQTVKYEYYIVYIYFTAIPKNQSS